MLVTMQARALVKTLKSDDLHPNAQERGARGKEADGRKSEVQGGKGQVEPAAGRTRVKSSVSQKGVPKVNQKQERRAQNDAGKLLDGNFKHAGGGGHGNSSMEGKEGVRAEVAAMKSANASAGVVGRGGAKVELGLRSQGDAKARDRDVMCDPGGGSENSTISGVAMVPGPAGTEDTVREDTVRVTGGLRGRLGAQTEGERTDRERNGESPQGAVNGGPAEGAENGGETGRKEEQMSGRELKLRLGQVGAQHKAVRREGEVEREDGEKDVTLTSLGKCDGAEPEAGHGGELVEETEARRQKDTCAEQVGETGARSALEQVGETGGRSALGLRSQRHDGGMERQPVESAVGNEGGNMGIENHISESGVCVGRKDARAEVRRQNEDRIQDTAKEIQEDAAGAGPELGHHKEAEAEDEKTQNSQVMCAEDRGANDGGAGLEPGRAGEQEEVLGDMHGRVEHMTRGSHDRADLLDGEGGLWQEASAGSGKAASEEGVGEGENEGGGEQEEEGEGEGACDSFARGRMEEDTADEVFGEGKIESSLCGPDVASQKPLDSEEPRLAEERSAGSLPSGAMDPRMGDSVESDQDRDIPREHLGPESISGGAEPESISGGAEGRTEASEGHGVVGGADDSFPHMSSGGGEAGYGVACQDPDEQLQLVGYQGASLFDYSSCARQPLRVLAPA